MEPQVPDQSHCTNAMITWLVTTNYVGQLHQGGFLEYLKHELVVKSAAIFGKYFHLRFAPCPPCIVLFIHVMIVVCVGDMHECV